MDRTVAGDDQNGYRWELRSAKGEAIADSGDTFRSRSSAEAGADGFMAAHDTARFDVVEREYRFVYVGHPRHVAGDKPPVRPENGEESRQALYSSRTGASSDGTAEMDFDIPVGAGLYERLDVEAAVSHDTREDGEKPQTDAGLPAAVDANEERQIVSGRPTKACDRDVEHDMGCQSLMIPPTLRRPRLSAQWKQPVGAQPVLEVIARMGDLSVDDRVLLSVRRVSGRKPGGRIYAAAWAPDARGVVEEKIAVPIGSRTRQVCVIMRSLRAASAPVVEGDQRFAPCPPPRSRGMAVQLTAAPKTGGSGT